MTMHNIFIGARWLTIPAFLFIVINVFAFNDDPFVPMLPQEVKRSPQSLEAARRAALETKSAPAEKVELPELVVSGVLWGTDNPMAIINNAVYTVGSVISGTGAKIHKIEKNIITVVYKTQLFTVTTAKQ